MEITNTTKARVVALHNARVGVSTLLGEPKLDFDSQLPVDEYSADWLDGFQSGLRKEPEKLTKLEYKSETQEVRLAQTKGFVTGSIVAYLANCNSKINPTSYGQNLGKIFGDIALEELVETARKIISKIDLKVGLAPTQGCLNYIITGIEIQRNTSKSPKVTSRKRSEL